MTEPAAAPHPATVAMVVSFTLSGSALLTALVTLWKVGRWMGRREATEEHVEKRLDEIALDVRDVRAFLMNQGAK